MSHFMPLKLSGQLINRDLLVRALTSLNFTPEVSETPIRMLGYYGDEQETAEIVLRRESLPFHCYSDVGFRLNCETGEYELIADDMSHRTVSQGLSGLKSAYLLAAREAAEALILEQIKEQEKERGQASLKWQELPGGTRRLTVTFARDRQEYAEQVQAKIRR